ncbi:CDP-diacylglycerol diphosphatase [Rhodopila sp.]|uniref:CDP-diacylglycerol diphosphatase n=1 Tax=Rhodopila sp. TaxID=2480087 RepID=UPI003D11C70B
MLARLVSPNRGLAVTLAAWMLVPPAACAADSSVLWKIVSGKCVPHEQTAGDPSPCSAVDLSHGIDKGFAVLKDINGVAQFLLIPTARIGGIEDPAILAPDVTNYWQDAWLARIYVEGRLHTNLPRDGFALAINSVDARSQNQLHIHIDCIRSDVRQALSANLDRIGGVWAPFPVPLAGVTYQAMRINQETLDGVDPFRVLAEDTQRSGDMAMHTLVLVGETFPDATRGFVLLDDHADLATGDRASGESLEDHSCAIARK